MAGGHERLVAQVAPAHALALGERVVGRAPQHPGALEERAALHAGADRAVGPHGQVDVTGGHAVDQLVHWQVADADHHLGPLGRVVADRGGQRGAGERERRTDAHHAGGAVAHVVGGALGGVEVAQHRLGRGQEVAACCRQRDAPRGAVEHAKAEDGLQLGHQLAHGLRREAQALGRGAEAVQLGHAGEGFELAQADAGEGHGAIIKR